MAMRYGIVNGQVVPLPPVDPSLNTATAGLPVQLPPVPRYQSPQLFINQQESAPNLTNIYTPSAPTLTNIYTPGPRPTLSNINQVPQRPGTRIEASTSAEDRRLARMGLEQRQRMNASTSGTAEPDFRVQWTPKPVEATPEDVARLGPNAAGILGVVSSVGSLSEEAFNLVGAAKNTAWDAVRGAAWDPAGGAAWNAAWDAAGDAAGEDTRYAAWVTAVNATGGSTSNVAGSAAGTAALAEAARDKLTPEQYKILTRPLATGATYDRILNSLPKNDRGSFRSAVMAAKPTSPEQVQQIANLPRRAMDNLGSLKGDMSFDKKIAAVTRVNRAMPADRLERLGFNQQNSKTNMSTSGSSDYGVQWTMEPVEVTPEDVARLGPNAAGVVGLLSSADSLSEEAAKLAQVARDAAWGKEWDAAGNVAWEAAKNATYNAAWELATRAATNAVEGTAADAAWNAAREAAGAEVVRDKITPEQYKIRTRPLATGVMYDRIMASLPENDRGSFRSAVMAAKPTSPEQVQQIANLPRRAMDNLGSLKGDMSFDKKIAAVSRVTRAMTADRAEREANRSKAVREVK